MTVRFQNNHSMVRIKGETVIKKMTAGTFGLTESVIKNDSSERLVLEAGEAIEFTDPETKYCKITFRGSGENAGGYTILIMYYPVLAGSTAVMGADDTGSAGSGTCDFCGIDIEV